jgi:acyl carrier protein
MADAHAQNERSAVAAEVARILLRHTHVQFAEGAIPPQTPLIDSGLELSSVRLLEALVEIEQCLHVRLTDEVMTLDALSSFALFVDHVCRLKSPA